MPPLIDVEGGVLIAVKAVPGASRDEIVGTRGDRLKLRIATPAESGRANRAICELLARELGVRPRDVSIVSGVSSAEKMIRVAGVSREIAEKSLGL